MNNSVSDLSVSLAGFSVTIYSEITEFTASVLTATGLHFQTMEDYVHRIGRTGRAGSTGRASSFYTDRDMVFYTIFIIFINTFGVIFFILVHEHQFFVLASLNGIMACRSSSWLKYGKQYQMFNLATLWLLLLGRYVHFEKLVIILLFICYTSLTLVYEQIFLAFLIRICGTFVFILLCLW